MIFKDQKIKRLPPFGLPLEKTWGKGDWSEWAQMQVSKHKSNAMWTVNSLVGESPTQSFLWGQSDLAWWLSLTIIALYPLKGNNDNNAGSDKVELPDEGGIKALRVVCGQKGKSAITENNICHFSPRHKLRDQRSPQAFDDSGKTSIRYFVAKLILPQFSQFLSLPFSDRKLF